MDFDENMTVDEAHSFIWAWIDTLSNANVVGEEAQAKQEDSLKKWRSVGMYLGLLREELSQA